MLPYLRYLVSCVTFYLCSLCYFCYFVPCYLQLCYHVARESLFCCYFCYLFSLVLEAQHAREAGTSNKVTPVTRLTCVILAYYKDKLRFAKQSHAKFSDTKNLEF